MDTLQLGPNKGRAKLLGTLLGVGGALVFVFYKGFELHIWSTHVDLLKSSNAGQSCGPDTENHHHISISGVLMVFGCNVSVALWLLLQASAKLFTNITSRNVKCAFWQAKISKEFGGHCWNISLMNATGSLVCMLVALSSEHNWNQWRLGWNISLLTTIYSVKNQST